MPRVSSAALDQPPSEVALGAVSARRQLAQDALELAKPGIVKLVLVTTSVGFGLAALGHRWDTLSLLLTAFWCLLGTALSAAGANALNMALEARRDGAMERTRHRPVPAGRMSAARAVLIGATLSISGVFILLLGTNPIAALVSLATILSYVFIYTPMKPITPLSTLVGAVPGALPPLIGWAAASVGPWRGMTEMGGWALVVIMFVWQVPHFLAIAWKYREDYARGGYRVLPVVDPRGDQTAWIALFWTLALVPLSLAPVVAMPGRLSALYVVIASVAGLWLAWFSLRLVRDRTDASARGLFVGSIVYLPLVLVTMVTDAVITGLG